MLTKKQMLTLCIGIVFGNCYGMKNIESLGEFKNTTTDTFISDNKIDTYLEEQAQELVQQLQTVEAEHYESLCQSYTCAEQINSNLSLFLRKVIFLIENLEHDKSELMLEVLANMQISEPLVSESQPENIKLSMLCAEKSHKFALLSSEPSSLQKAGCTLISQSAPLDE